MIPDRLPSRVSKGEEKVFGILKKLPDDCVIYYEPIVAQRFPDFIVISPRLGVLIIEVKGWYSKNIVEGDPQNIKLRIQSDQSSKHPTRQAREYMYLLMDECRKIEGIDNLLNNTKGEHEGKFIFPFGNMIVLNNIEKRQLQQHVNGDMTVLFPEAKTLYREQLNELMNLSSNLLELRLKDFFDPWWKFPSLTEKQVSLIRAIIHPEISLNDFNKVAVSLKILDLEQEKNARNIGEGHRLVSGIAGSGKTVLLIAKAKLLSQREDKPEILVLCYSLPLSFYLKNVFSEYINIKALHFDGWAKSLHCTRHKDESNDDLGERLLQRLTDGCTDTRRYDAVMIDEAQDFDPTWFKCALESMKDCYDGDLLIVGDRNQNVFKTTDNKKIIWKDLGISVTGGRSTILKINYRNTNRLLKLASVFSSKNMSEENDGGLSIVPVDLDCCKREGDFSPDFIECSTREEEVNTIVETVDKLLSSKELQGSEVVELKPSDIGILYRHADKEIKCYINDLLDRLRQFTDVVWLNESSDSRQRVNEPGVKIQTVHSAKGLQYKVVIIMGADLFPARFANTDEEQERNLFYVALTRPEEYLMITATGSSPFTQLVKKYLS